MLTTTMLWAHCVLLLAILASTTATVVKPSSCLISEINNINLSLICYESNGEVKDVSSPDEHVVVYEGTRCVQMCNPAKFRTAYCGNDGGWEYHPEIALPCVETHESQTHAMSNQNDLHHRSKRCGLACINTIVTVIKIAVDVLCMVKVFDCGGTKRDTTPPTITCQPTTQISPIVALPGERDAVVSWPAPTASDDSGSVVVKKWLPIDKNSGDRFASGSYIILYVANDPTGNMASCSPVTFDVKVYMCPYPRIPINGDHNYTASEQPLLGDRIHFSCVDGYSLSTGSSYQVCQLSGNQAVWSGSGLVTCSKVKCSSRIPTANTELICTSTVDEFGTSCMALCINSSYAYANEPGKKRYTSCTATGQWSDPLDSCIDARPPVVKNCPVSKTVYTDRAVATATVYWNAIYAVDNAGNNVSATPIQAPFASGSSSVAVGIYDFEYTAIDSRRLEATTHCYFSIRVDVTPCPPLASQTMLLMTPPSSLIYGSCYNFTCGYSFKMLGPSTVCCERNETTPSVGYWDWSVNNNTPTTCRVLNCSKLHVPDNGALACDANWALGGMCSMLCNDQYDIPIVFTTMSALGVYSCDRTTGVWNPSAFVPDCSESRKAGSSYLRSSLFYFSGDCTDPSVQVIIKNQFIGILKDPVAGPIFGSICDTPNLCVADNIEVECGANTLPASRRKRRGAFTHKLTVRFQMRVQLTYPIGKKKKVPTATLR